MIKVYVLPEIAVEGRDLKDALVISIVSPGREHPKITGNHVYRFHFHDVGQVYELPDGRLIQPMSETIAEAIVDVAMEHRYCNEWIIHCEAGISRSAGVVIGMSKYLKFEPNRRNLKKMFPLFNKHVCQLIEEAMEVKIKEIDAELNSPGCIGEES